MRGALALILFVLAAIGLAQEPPPAPAPIDARPEGVSPAMAHGPEGVACVHCHADPHSRPAGSDPAGAGAVGTTCQQCHATEAWKPTLFTVADHAKTKFALEGKHAAVACGECHVEAKLVGQPMECAGCHVDRHRGKLGGECTECHSVNGFTPVEGFDHAARTGFALTGHHADVACDSCHQGDNGRVLRTVATATCDTCHARPHADFGPCADCHTDEQPAFADARTAFDHHATAFRLERRHASQPCDSCHPVAGPGPDVRCQACHPDPHSGQLGTSCSDCHRPDRWRLVRFDHDLAGWPLRGRHFVTPCGSCHTNQRWIGLRSECWDCHALDARRGPAFVPAHTTGLADCSDCHGQWTW